MIEVFKTDVKDGEYARVLVELIHEKFPGYRANFDLSDCDNILRIHSATGSVRVTSLIYLLNEFGFNAEVLPDEVPLMSQLRGYVLFRKAMYS